METQLPHGKGESSLQPPLFGPCLLWPNGWMDQVPLGTEVGLGPGNIVFDGSPAPPRKGAQQPISPLFGPRLLWRKRSPISASAELLLAEVKRLYILAKL